MKPLLDQILCEVPATKEINIFFIYCSPIHPWSRNLPACQFPEQHLYENGIYNRHPVQIIFSAAPKANPAKLLGSVGFSAGVDQDIRQLETPLVFSLDNYKCRILKWVSPSGSRCNIQSSLTLSTATAAFSSTSSSPPPSSTHLRFSFKIYLELDYRNAIYIFHASSSIIIIGTMIHTIHNLWASSSLGRGCKSAGRPLEMIMVNIFSIIIITSISIIISIILNIIITVRTDCSDTLLWTE